MQTNPYQSLVTLLSNILDAYTTAFFLLDPRTRRLELTASQTLSRFLMEKASFPLEQSGIISQVQKVGQTIHFDKVHEAAPSLPQALPFYREGEAHIKGLFAVPVGDGLGVLYVDTKHGWGFNDKQQKWIVEVAAMLHEIVLREGDRGQREHCSRILEFWRRLDQASLQGDSLEDYCGLLVAECCRLLDAEFGFLALMEAGEDAYRLMAGTGNIPQNFMNQRFLANQGLIGRIFQNNKPFLVSRLNPQAADHFLFIPSEGLPHSGAFWGLPARMSLGHAVVIAFLSRKDMEWNLDCQNAISHTLCFSRLLIEQFYFKEACDHLRNYDFSTGFDNALAFESRVDDAVNASLQNSTPFALALMQFEPWQMLSTKASPRQIRRLQGDLAEAVVRTLPAGVAAGQIAENRFAFLFTETSLQEAKRHLSGLVGIEQNVLAGRIRGTTVKSYLAAVGFPQDGTRSEELWPLVYNRLYVNLRTKSSNVGV
mgnify:CR=1 FL=1